MRRYLSYGGGVNSTALMLWLLDQGIEFETVYADHSGDWPETRAYVEALQVKGYPITVLDTAQCNTLSPGKTLDQYIIETGSLPAWDARWCTKYWKVRPLHLHFQRPAIVYLAFGADEAQRAKPSRDPELTHEFPLIDEGMSREDCKRYIEAHGLAPPRKSTCYFCFNQSAVDIVRLRTEHPDLYCRIEQMEAACARKQAALGRKPYYLFRKPIASISQRDQLDMFGEREVRPCLCGL